MQRNLDRYVIGNPVHIKRMFVEHGTVFVEMAHIRADTTFKIKVEFVVVTFVDKAKAQAFVEVRHFAEALRQRAEVVVEGLDDGRIWQKRRFGAMAIGWLDIGDVALGDTTFENLVVVAAVAIDIDAAIRRQGVDGRHTHAVKP